MTYIATFYSHFGAMHFKKQCEARGMAAKIMPVPRDLSSSCGTCVRYEGDRPCPSDAWSDEVEQAVEVTAQEGGGKQRLAVSALFVAIGLEPDNAPFAPPLALDDYGYVLAGEDCKTNVPGVFVAGDSRTKLLRQIVTAVADGAVAAMQAERFLH